jgi:hypothetical protein
MFFESDFSEVRDTVSYECIITAHNNSQLIWAAFGAADMNIIHSKRPKWIYRVLEHGSYVMSCDQWVAASNTPEINNKQSGFSFGKDDVIRVTYNARTKDLMLEKNPGKHFPQVPSHARPCVLLIHEGVTVTVR